VSACCQKMKNSLAIMIEFEPSLSTSFFTLDIICGRLGHFLRQIYRDGFCGLSWFLSVNMKWDYDSRFSGL
jgi:hypothetical protein